ncbi:MAG: lipoyl(octanoyl) transferase LipB [Bacteroidetes bacterium]|nr:lipoyl(octanoyl) transferase LipB [Bacteroidota bacterium]
MKQNKEIIVQHLGTLDYKKCWDYQEKLFNEIIQQKLFNRENPTDIKPTKNYILFVEHPNVYTMGKSGNNEHLLISNEQLKNISAEFYKINRGGDITFHGPGQMVVYPILDLDNFFTDIHKYLRLLEESIIDTLKSFDINAGRSKGETGVWLDADIITKARKICAMGVRCSRWVTMHGLALNVNTDLNYFNYIVPCGITNKAVTSMEKEIIKKIKIELVEDAFKNNFEKLFNVTFKEENTLTLDIS